MFPDVPIRSIQLVYRMDGDYNLQGLRLFTDNHKLVFEIGDRESGQIKECTLAEDERIVGFQSRGVDGHAFHRDF